MTCCPCGLSAHGTETWGNRGCESFHLRLSGPCSRCRCTGRPRMELVAEELGPRVVVSPLLPVELLPPGWIRAIFRWSVDADGTWVTAGGSTYGTHGGLYLSPMDTTIVSSILERIVPNES